MPPFFLSYSAAEGDASALLNVKTEKQQPFLRLLFLVPMTAVY